MNLVGSNQCGNDYVLSSRGDLYSNMTHFMPKDGLQVLGFLKGWFKPCRKHLVQSKQKGKASGTSNYTENNHCYL